MGRIVLEGPQLFPRVKEDRRMRRVPVARFPYSVVYADGPDHVRIVAFAHAKREPGYWRHRLT